MLAIGAMRYVFVAAMRPWPRLEWLLRESRRRKLVCVWQVACLLLCLLPAIGGALATALLVLALALLAWSFAVDVRWLYHTRPQSRPRKPHSQVPGGERKMESRKRFPACSPRPCWRASSVPRRPGRSRSYTIDPEHFAIGFQVEHPATPTSSACS